MSALKLLLKILFWGIVLFAVLFAFYDNYYKTNYAYDQVLNILHGDLNLQDQHDYWHAVKERQAKKTQAQAQKTRRTEKNKRIGELRRQVVRDCTARAAEKNLSGLASGYLLSDLRDYYAQFSPFTTNPYEKYLKSAWSCMIDAGIEITGCFYLPELRKSLKRMEALSKVECRAAGGKYCDGYRKIEAQALIAVQAYEDECEKNPPPTWW